MLIYYFCSLLVIGTLTQNGVYSASLINLNFSIEPKIIAPSRPVKLSCVLYNYTPGSANYSVSFFRGHNVNDKNLIASHEVYTYQNKQNILFSSGKFSDAIAHSGRQYTLPLYEVDFEPKANLTPYEAYWCELNALSGSPKEHHISNLFVVSPSVTFELTARNLSPITATCTISNFNPSTVKEYQVHFYNAGSSHIYSLAMYRVKVGFVEEFIPDPSQPEVVVHGKRFTFPVFEIFLGQRFNYFNYYCALEIEATGFKIASNQVLG